MYTLTTPIHHTHAGTHARTHARTHKIHTLRLYITNTVCFQKKKVTLTPSVKLLIT